jgi:hypothetical protein
MKITALTWRFLTVGHSDGMDSSWGCTGVDARAYTFHLHATANFAPARL